MKLTTQQLAKSDAPLQKALSDENDSTPLRVIMRLGRGDDLVSTTRDEEINPARYPSRQEYRRALIEQQSRHVAEELSGTLQLLRELPLTLQGGGTISRSIVVEGAVKAIAQALELPGVLYAQLDRPIALIEPASEPVESSPSSSESDKSLQTHQEQQAPAERKSFSQPTSVQLPNEMMHRLTTFLLQFDEFESFAHIEHFFDDPDLRPWQDKLPRSHSRIHQLHQMIGYLFNTYAYLPNQTNLLVLVLEKLQQRYDANTNPQNRRRSQLIDEVQREVEREIQDASSQRQHNDTSGDARELQSRYAELQRRLHLLNQRRGLLENAVHRRTVVGETQQNAEQLENLNAAIAAIAAELQAIEQALQ